MKTNKYYMWVHSYALNNCCDICSGICGGHATPDQSPIWKNKMNVINSLEGWNVWGVSSNNKPNAFPPVNGHFSKVLCRCSASKWNCRTVVICVRRFFSLPKWFVIMSSVKFAAKRLYCTGISQSIKNQYSIFPLRGQTTKIWCMNYPAAVGGKRRIFLSENDFHMDKCGHNLWIDERINCGSSLTSSCHCHGLIIQHKHKKRRLSISIEIRHATPRTENVLYNLYTRRTRNNQYGNSPCQNMFEQ